MEKGDTVATSYAIGDDKHMFFLSILIRTNIFLTHLPQRKHILSEITTSENIIHNGRSI